MRTRLAVLALLVLGSSCKTPERVLQRVRCKLQCPTYSHCEAIYENGSFVAFGCVCDGKKWQFPTKASPCPAPTPFPLPGIPPSPNTQKGQ